MKAVRTQAVEILRFLETHCGVYDLRVRGLPIWWFVRYRFFLGLVDSLLNTPGDPSVPRGSARLSNPFRLARKFRCFVSRAGVFLLRALVTAARLIALRGTLRGKVMFVPVSRLCQRLDKKSDTWDILIDPIRQHLLSDSVIIEKPSLNANDRISLWHRKGCLFLDWWYLTSALFTAPMLARRPRVEGIDKTAACCQDAKFDGIQGEQLANQIVSFLNRQSRRIVVQSHAARRLMQQLRPKAVVGIASYDSSSIALSLMAKRQGVAVFELQHGAIELGQIGYTYYVPESYQGEKPVPDCIFVHGRAARDAILGSNTLYAEGDIAVVGSPRMYSFLESLDGDKRSALRSIVREKLRIAQDAFLVTVTTQPTTVHCLVSFLCEALSNLQLESLKLCLKIHPSERDTWRRAYGALACRPQVLPVEDGIVSLYELLVASDLHVTVYSTVLLESMALGTPNIILRCPGYEKVRKLLEDEELLVAERPQDFVRILLKIRDRPNYYHSLVETGVSRSTYFFRLDTPPDVAMASRIAHAMRHGVGAFDTRPSEGKL